MSDITVDAEPVEPVVPTRPPELAQDVLLAFDAHDVAHDVNGALLGAETVPAAELVTELGKRVREQGLDYVTVAKSLLDLAPDALDGTGVELVVQPPAMVKLDQAGLRLLGLEGETGTVIVAGQRRQKFVLR